jgi:L-ribulokinase
MRVTEIFAVGGIAEKSPFIVQLLADVLNLPIRLSAAKNATAMGAAVMAAVAAGTERGGFATVREAAEAFNPGVQRTFVPDQKNAAVYEELFREYEVLHDYFGRTNRAMKNLKRIKARTQS